MAEPIKIRELRPYSWGSDGQQGELDLAHALVEGRWAWVEELEDPEQHGRNLSDIAYVASAAVADAEAAATMLAYWEGSYRREGLNEPEKIIQERDEKVYHWGLIALQREERVTSYVAQMVHEIWTRLGGRSDVADGHHQGYPTLGEIDARWRQRIRVQWDADGVGVPDPGQEDRDE